MKRSTSVGVGPGRLARSAGGPWLAPPVLACLVFFSACGDTTGSGLVTFTARAGGPADVTADAPLEFDTGSGFHISLESAKFHFGAIYLNMSVPTSGADAQPCILPGIY